MKYDDSVYGEQKIEKDVIKELIKTQPLQRLKNIQQAGPQTYFMDKNEVTRFEHSLGVFFLLREYGASTEEQIAGLLHDVPHTAFSHLVDFVFETEDHEYHERFMEEVIYESMIPEILEKYGYETENILDESRYKLLERDLPALCADRIDYFLRDTTVAREEDITYFLENLEVKDNLFVLNDKERAEKYALEYIQTDQELWANPKEVAVFEIFAEIVKRAIKLDKLTEKDLFQTDEEVYSIIKNIEDDFIQEKLDILNKDFAVELVEDKEEADIISKTKARAVDPDVKTEDGLVKVSSYSNKLKEQKKQHRENIESGYKMKLNFN